MTHLSKDILRDKLTAGYEAVKLSGVFSHYKSPASRYIVEKLVILEATEEIAVLYFSIDDPDITFVRPLESWIEVVDGQPRFYRLD